MKTKFALTMALAGSVLLVGCSDDDDDNVAPQNILEIAVENANTTVLEAAVLEADPAIAALLGGDDELTVFAPTDAAFQALLNDLGITAEQLLASTDLLNTVLKYHVLATSVGEVEADPAISGAQSPIPPKPGSKGGKVKTSPLSISQEKNEEPTGMETPSPRKPVPEGKTPTKGRYSPFIQKKEPPFPLPPKRILHVNTKFSPKLAQVYSKPAV